MSKLFALAAFLAGTTLAAQQSASDTAAVRRVVEQVARSFDQNDPDLLDRITSADYMFASPNGVIEAKAARLAPMRSGTLHYASAKYDEIVVHVHGSTAVATARVTTRATLGTEDRSGVFRATLVFVREGSAWMMIASSATALKS
jgi:ketosteroid isomerase-like protein